MLNTKTVLQLIESHVVSLSLAIRRWFKSTALPCFNMPGFRVATTKEHSDSKRGFPRTHFSRSVPGNHCTLHWSPEHSTHSKHLNCQERFTIKVAHSYSEGQKIDSLVLDFFPVLSPCTTRTAVGSQVRSILFAREGKTYPVMCAPITSKVITWVWCVLWNEKRLNLRSSTYEKSYKVIGSSLLP